MPLAFNRDENQHQSIDYAIVAVLKNTSRFTVNRKPYFLITRQTLTTYQHPSYGHDKKSFEMLECRLLRLNRLGCMNVSDYTAYNPSASFLSKCI